MNIPNLEKKGLSKNNHANLPGNIKAAEPWHSVSNTILQHNHITFKVSLNTNSKVKRHTTASKQPNPRNEW